MFTVDYTKEYDVDSSLVEGVFYNANDRTLFLDLNSEFYKYTDVDELDFADLIDSDSVGAYYNTHFKHDFGPAVHLGSYYDSDINRVVPIKETPGTPKGLTVTDATTATREYGLRLDDDTHTFEDDSDESPTPEFSLSTPAPTKGVELQGNVTSTVYFTLDDYDKVYTFDGSQVDVEDAIDEVNEYVTRVGGKGKVKKVVFEFVE